MNQSENQDRQFLIVQLPFDNAENQREGFNICRSVTVERIRRAVRGYAQRGEKKTSVEPLGGSFTYARVGEPLFDEYRDFGKRLPAFEELARYVFYTETSRDCDPKKFNPETGFIGATELAGGTSYYMLYSPNRTEDRELSLQTLAHLAKIDKRGNWVVYCEKIWLHQDQLQKFEREQGKRVRPMLVPFQLK